MAKLACLTLSLSFFFIKGINNILFAFFFLKTNVINAMLSFIFKKILRKPVLEHATSKLSHAPDKLS